MTHKSYSFKSIKKISWSHPKGIQHKASFITIASWRHPEGILKRSSIILKSNSLQRRRWWNNHATLCILHGTKCLSRRNHGVTLTLKTMTFFSHFHYSQKSGSKSDITASKKLTLYINIQLRLVTIHWLTQFLKSLLINQRKMPLKNTLNLWG